MSKKSYIKNTYQVHTFVCSFDVGGKERTTRYTYSGNVIDGIIACYKDNLWSNHPTFRIESINSVEV